MLERVMLAVLAVAMGTATATAHAQVKHLPAGQSLGEGTRQSDDAPLPIPHAQPRPRPAAANARPMSVRVAESVMRRNPQTHRRWDYTQRVVLNASERVALARKNPAMLAYVKTNMDRWVKPDGSIEGYELHDYNIDEIAQGPLLFGLYERTKDPRYKKAADLLRSQLRTHPRTGEGGFWHKKIYPNQMWLDGLYMGQPFYAQYARTFNEPAAFDDIARQFLLVTRHTRDPRTSLMYHGWDEAKEQKWANPETGLSKNFWARAAPGWMANATRCGTGICCTLAAGVAKSLSSAMTRPVPHGFIWSAIQRMLPTQPGGLRGRTHRQPNSAQWSRPTSGASASISTPMPGPVPSS